MSVVRVRQGTPDRGPEAIVPLPELLLLPVESPCYSPAGQLAKSPANSIGYRRLTGVDSEGVRRPSALRTGDTMGRKSIAGVMVVAAAACFPFEAGAQQHHRRRGHGQEPAGGAAAPAAGGNDAAGMSFTPEEAQTAAPAPDAAPLPPDNGGTAASASGSTPGAGGSGGSGDLLGVPGGEVSAARHPLHEDIYAVQQIYALRNHRLELTPSLNVSLNDPFVSHVGVGLSANYWISNVLAVGLTGVFFQGLNASSDVNYFVGRSTGLVVPINEYQFAAALNFTYVPLYGKFSMFNRYIFHWDMYLTAGVGVMRSRPIPAIDPEVRTFDWGTHIMFDAGVGVRVFISRSVGITAELRNFIYPELLESTTVGPETGTVNGQPSTQCSNCRRNPATWTNTNSLTDNVMASIGLTIFLPFSFTYRLPK